MYIPESPILCVRVCLELKLFLNVTVSQTAEITYTVVSVFHVDCVLPENKIILYY